MRASSSAVSPTTGERSTAISSTSLRRLAISRSRLSASETSTVSKYPAAPSAKAGMFSASSMGSIGVNALDLARVRMAKSR